MTKQILYLANEYQHKNTNAGEQKRRKKERKKKLKDDISNSYKLTSLWKVFFRTTLL